MMERINENENEKVYRKVGEIYFSFTELKIISSYEEDDIRFECELELYERMEENIKKLEKESGLRVYKEDEFTKKDEPAIILGKDCRLYLYIPIFK